MSCYVRLSYSIKNCRAYFRALGTLPCHCHAMPCLCWFEQELGQPLQFALLQTIHGKNEQFHTILTMNSDPYMVRATKHMVYIDAISISWFYFQTYIKQASVGTMCLIGHHACLWWCLLFFSMVCLCPYEQIIIALKRVHPGNWNIWYLYGWCIHIWTQLHLIYWN